MCNQKIYHLKAFIIYCLEVRVFWMSVLLTFHPWAYLFSFHYLWKTKPILSWPIWIDVKSHSLVPGWLWSSFLQSRNQGHQEAITYLRSELQGKLYLVCSKSLQSCLTLCDPMDCKPPGSSVHRILQARTLKWVAISLLRDTGWIYPIKLLMGYQTYFNNVLKQNML